MTNWIGVGDFETLLDCSSTRFPRWLTRALAFAALKSALTASLNPSKTSETWSQLIVA